MFTDNGGMARENKTIEAMTKVHCHTQHGDGDQLCLACGELLEYGQERLRRCPLQDNKATCTKCPVHCYRPDMRQKIRAIMRYTGRPMPY